MKELDLQKTRQVNYRRKNLKSWLIDDDDQAPSSFPVITQLVCCLYQHELLRYTTHPGKKEIDKTLNLYPLHRPAAEAKADLTADL